jgi:hypothetical protein
MARQVMKRSAADNVYRHMDFHGALSTGIAYLEEHFGPDAVRDYLRQFARKFYAPLTRELQNRGLDALRDHLERLYAREGGRIRVKSSTDELLLEVLRNPAVIHLRRRRYPVAPLFLETSRTLFEAWCEGTPYEARWLRYDARTGRCAVRFRRRLP